jgi:hypothetical protein
MNELIKRFAKDYLLQDKYTAYGEVIEGDYYEFDPVELVGFVKLIVKECIDKISQEQDLAEQNWLCDNGVHICHELPKHFGLDN